MSAQFFNMDYVLLDTQECAMCRDGGGYCRYNRIYNDLGDIIDQVFTCSPNRYLPSTHPSNNRSSMGVILGNTFL